MGYNIGDKFLVKLDLFYWGERSGAIVTENADLSKKIISQKLDPFVDLNFGIDYRYSKNFSAFIQINNIANGRYQRFANYPVYGINFLGGFTFTF
jgi:outer membrane receptor protein involved in Fe transport